MLSWMKYGAVSFVVDFLRQMVKLSWKTPRGICEAKAKVYCLQQYVYLSRCRQDGINFMCIARRRRVFHSGITRVFPTAHLLCFSKEMQTFNKKSSIVFFSLFSPFSSLPRSLCSYFATLSNLSSSTPKSLLSPSFQSTGTVLKSQFNPERVTSQVSRSGKFSCLIHWSMVNSHLNLVFIVSLNFIRSFGFPMP